MSKFSENLKQLRLEASMTQKELAQKLNVSQNAIFNWENEKREPSLEMIDQIAYFFNVSSSYLLGHTKLRNTLKYALDKATILHTDNDYLIKIVRLFSTLNESGQQKAVKQIDLLSKIPEYQKASAPGSKIIVLPYFRAGVSAGSGIFILGNEAEDEIELPDLPEYEAADFAIDINGDSMEPDFSHDDIALVQQDAELSPGDIGVFVINGDAFIKELGENELISRNKDYKNIPIHEGDNVVCMGKVIGKVKTDEE